MKLGMAGRGALMTAGLSLALGLAACSDPQADAKAKADEEAAAAAAKADAKLASRVRHGVECINALRWQEGALAGAGIGSVKLYSDYFAAQLDEAIGTATIKTTPPEPTLSRAALPEYLAWSYPQDVKTKFTAGTDTNKDGTVSAHERNFAGFAKVLACVQEVAEMGKGPLAGNDKVGRMFRIQELRSRLKDKGA